MISAVQIHALLAFVILPCCQVLGPTRSQPPASSLTLMRHLMAKVQNRSL